MTPVAAIASRTSRRHVLFAPFLRPAPRQWVPHEWVRRWSVSHQPSGVADRCPGARRRCRARRVWRRGRRHRPRHRRRHRRQRGRRRRQRTLEVHRRQGSGGLAQGTPPAGRRVRRCRRGASTRPAMRTYTVRAHRADIREVDIDLLDHGDTGPGSRLVQAVQAMEYPAGTPYAWVAANGTARSAPDTDAPLTVADTRVEASRNSVVTGSPVGARCGSVTSRRSA